MFEGGGGGGGRSKQDLSLEMCNWRMPKSSFWWKIPYAYLKKLLCHQIAICSSPIIHFVCPQKNLLKHCLHFLWEDHNTKEKF